MPRRRRRPLPRRGRHGGGRGRRWRRRRTGGPPGCPAATSAAVLAAPRTGRRGRLVLMVLLSGSRGSASAPTPAPSWHPAMCHPRSSPNQRQKGERGGAVPPILDVAERDHRGEEGSALRFASRVTFPRPLLAACLIVLLGSVTHARTPIAGESNALQNECRLRSVSLFFSLHFAQSTTREKPLRSGSNGQTLVSRSHSASSLLSVMLPSDRQRRTHRGT